MTLLRISRSVCAVLGAALVAVPTTSCTIADRVGQALDHPEHYGPAPGGRDRRSGGADAVRSVLAKDVARADSVEAAAAGPDGGTATSGALAEVGGEEAVFEIADAVDISDAERFETPDGRRLRSLDSRRFESGLVVHVLRRGDEAAAACAADSKIVVHYHGTLGDGTVVDTTRGGEPVGPWPLKQLMPGWQRGLTGMHVGAVRRLEIPAALGYGDEPVIDPKTGREMIPAGADLIYAIELLEVH